MSAILSTDTFGSLHSCKYQPIPSILTSRLVVIPLSFLRRLDSLKYTSVIALIAIGYLVILVLAHFIKGDTIQDRGEVNYVTWGGPVAFLANLPVIVFAYTCHQNVSSLFTA
jgi:amino acid permease